MLQKPYVNCGNRLAHYHFVKGHPKERHLLFLWVSHWSSLYVELALYLFFACSWNIVVKFIISKFVSFMQDESHCIVRSCDIRWPYILDSCLPNALSANSYSSQAFPYTQAYSACVISRCQEPLVGTYFPWEQKIGILKTNMFDSSTDIYHPERINTPKDIRLHAGPSEIGGSGQHLSNLYGHPS